MLKRTALRIYLFVNEVYTRIRDNELVDMANALTFKLILSLFPFIIFLMSCIAFLDLDVSSLKIGFENEIPGLVSDIINSFISEVVDTKRISLLSSSLLVSWFSASSGIYTMMRGLNRAYGVSEQRGYFTQRFISLLIVMVFTVLIIISLYACIFSDKINEMIFNIAPSVPLISVNARSYAITAALIFTMIILIYMLALVKRPKIRQLIPGTVFTMGGWLLLSKVFNIYVNNFSRYSTVYGSIGAIFVFALWLNLLSYDLLIGGQINAIIYDKKWIEEVLINE